YAAYLFEAVGYEGSVRVPGLVVEVFQKAAQSCTVRQENVAETDPSRNKAADTRIFVSIITRISLGVKLFPHVFAKLGYLSFVADSSFLRFSFHFSFHSGL
ncbi:MAG: hypothetical protein LBO68_00025, partial [Synergistaceae bacterium]|nr:hypothetical protein [Synergistaceae bacterium]